MNIEKDYLYHYTSIESLNCILLNKNIWLSDCRFLNDTKELKSAISLLLSYIPEHNKKAVMLGLGAMGHYYFHCLLSLSKSPKVLSQWRAYGDDGRGAAIGFDYECFKQVEQDIRKEIVSCVYRKHDEFIKSLLIEYEAEIATVVDMFKSEPAINIFFRNIESNRGILSGLITQLLRVKNIAFLEEREYRVIAHIPKSKIKTRTYNNLIIPYFEHSLIGNDESFIFCVTPEIWLGPKSDERNVDSISNAFSNYGITLSGGIKKYDCGYV